MVKWKEKKNGSIKIKDKNKIEISFGVVKDFFLLEVVEDISEQTKKKKKEKILLLKMKNKKLSNFFYLLVQIRRQIEQNKI